MKLEEFELGDNPKQCPCCDYFSLESRGKSMVCPVCFWEDDCLDFNNPSLDVPSDTNDDMTLRQARENYHSFGACHSKFVDVVISKKERSSLYYEPRNV